MFGELVIGSGSGNPNPFGVVGDLVREEGEHREALIEALGAQPLVRRHGVTLSKRQLGQVPHGMVRDAGSIGVEHDLGDLGDLERVSFVCGVDLEFPECHDGRSVEGPATRCASATLNAPRARSRPRRGSRPGAAGDLWSSRRSAAPSSADPFVRPGRRSATASRASSVRSSTSRTHERKIRTRRARASSRPPWSRRAALRTVLRAPSKSSSWYWIPDSGSSKAIQQASSELA